MKTSFKLLTLVALLVAFLPGCKPQLTDTGGFALYYPGVTDIGPSTNMTISPTWHGGKPSAFEVYQVKLDGAVIKTDCFKADAESGIISISGTDDLAVGQYAISVACTVDGARYSFDDVILVNMLPVIPAGIKVNPSQLVIPLADIMDGKELPKAQIECEGDHISITSYSIANVVRDGVKLDSWSGLFDLSAKGEFSIKEGNLAFIPGVYVFDFKLTTAVVGKDSELGIFTEALTLDVQAAPTSLEYTPAEGVAEEKIAFQSTVPAFVGSQQGLSFAIKAADSPEVRIDAATGVISLPENHTLAAGSAVNVSVTATNALGTKDFDNVYIINVVEYIEPITAFAYDDKADVVQGTGFTNAVKQIAGGAVSFALSDDNTEVVKENITVDAVTGEVSAVKGNSLTVGNHTVKVEASNIKGSLEASFTLTIVENPNYFTYVHWGNNLGLTPARNYASQYRMHAGDAQITIPIAESDIPAGRPVKFSKAQNNSNGYTFDETTGTFTLKAHTANTLSIVSVTVTVGEGEEAVTRRFPVAFHQSIGAILIEYTPFVVKINPKTGGRSAAPVVTPETPALTFDFRRSFNYVNLDGPESHKNGAPSVAGSLLYSVWDTYFSALGKNINTGARDPFSWYVNKDNPSIAAGYIDQTTRELVINPDKFKTVDGYANGLFVGQTPYVAAGGDPASGVQVFTIAAWLDINHE